MVRITEELLRKRSEHNEGLIHSLEELSLHQEGIERIENLDKWCRHLTILLLPNNLISKIENVGRLKKLEYLNLALNNIKTIENLEGCESLNKLDLTLNFITELTSVDSLKPLHHLKTLYLTGNPCTNYNGYRDYVVASLSQLQFLDGQRILKSERLAAEQNYNEVKAQIILQQKAEHSASEEQQPEVTAADETLSSEFWKEKTKYTPESRTRAYNLTYRKQSKRNTSPETNGNRPETRRLHKEDGQMLNINEPKLQFLLTEDSTTNVFNLEIKGFRYMKIEDLDLTIETKYIRLLVKGQVFQLVLPEPIHPDQSVAERSLATGRLFIRMLKANGMPFVKKEVLPKSQRDLSTLTRLHLEEEDRTTKSETKLDKQRVEQEKAWLKVAEDEVPELVKVL